MLLGFGQLPDSPSLHGCSCVGLVLVDASIAARS